MPAAVLVIEDNTDVARAIRAVLEGGGLEVLTEGDGRAGLHAFHACHPGLVVLDVGLPVLDGWDVLNRLRDLSDVPVLILTSHGLEAEKVRGLGAGADDFVTKPYSNAELLARVQALLRRGGPGRGRGRGRGRRGVRRRPDPWASNGREVSVADRAVRLTPTEFRLLGVLVRHPARSCRRTSCWPRSGRIRRGWAGPGEVRRHAAAAQARPLRRGRPHRGGAGSATGTSARSPARPGRIALITAGRWIARRASRTTVAGQRGAPPAVGSEP